MDHISQITFSNGNQAVGIEIVAHTALYDVVGRLGLEPPRRTLVVVGGAGKMSDDEMMRARDMFENVLGPLAAAFRLVMVDGGTKAGVMQLAGEARAQQGAGFDLVGVAAIGTVVVPGRAEQPPAGAELDPHHSRFILVPGTEWGTEAPWIARIASVIADGLPSATLLINGGEIAWKDVRESVDMRRSVLVVAGSGRTADILARAVRGEQSESHVVALIATGLIKVVDPEQGHRHIAEMLADVLELPREEVRDRICHIEPLW